MAPALLVALAYLIGSVSFAVVTSKLFALPDPRKYGSGNPGATNVLRSGNKAAAALTLFGDAAKGWLAVAIAQRLTSGEPNGDLVVAASALAVFLGHLFPIFHRFVGGKGVATAAGVIFALSPLLGLAALGIWLLVALIFRISSVAALTAAFAAPFVALAMLGNRVQAWVLIPIALLLLWRHRSNIAKLRAGQETRIGR